MEHYRPNGGLSQGYFCCRCGLPVAMMGHSERDRLDGTCTPNPELVDACRQVNLPSNVKGRVAWTGTQTGRFSSKDLPPQDFSKLEARVLADFADPEPDPHTKEAMRIFEVSQLEVTKLMRNTAKVVSIIKRYP